MIKIGEIRKFSFIYLLLTTGQSIANSGNNKVRKSVRNVFFLSITHYIGPTNSTIQAFDTDDIYLHDWPKNNARLQKVFEIFQQSS